MLITVFSNYAPLLGNRRERRAAAHRLRAQDGTGGPGRDDDVLLRGSQGPREPLSPPLQVGQGQPRQHARPGVHEEDQRAAGDRVSELPATLVAWRGLL